MTPNQYRTQSTCMRRAQTLREGKRKLIIHNEHQQQALLSKTIISEVFNQFQSTVKLFSLDNPLTPRKI